MRLILVLMLLAMCSLTAAHAAGLTLARDGKPCASIVLSKLPTRAAQFAAYELQYHLKLISGADVPILAEDQPCQGLPIYVGESAATHRLGLTRRLKSQEYLIRFLPNALVLMGKDKPDFTKVEYVQTPTPEQLATWPDMWEETGTMYAVYDFLQRYCNVRWFQPNEFGTDCPKQSTLTVSGADVDRTPFFRYRYACYLPGENYDKFTLLQPKTDDEWKAYDAAAYPEVTKLSNDWWHWIHAKRGYVTLFRYRMRDGGEMTPGNHSLYGYYDRFWEANPQSPALFEAKHADWFAQGYEGRPPQMCYTSRGLIEQVAKDACEFFETGVKHPGAQAAGNFFCVEPMDNASFCKCDKCQALIKRTRQETPTGSFSGGEDSDYFFTFVNEVAKLVRQKHPDKYIVALAYATHAYPPKTFKLEPNVAIQYCFACNRMPYATEQYNNEVRALEAWGKQSADRPMYLWLYYTFPVEVATNGKFHAFPGFFAHKIGEQFKLFARNGYRGMFHCGYGQEVEAYVTYRLMDDPSLDVDKLLAGYFTRFYGPAAAPLKSMYLDIEKTYCDPKNWPEKPGHESVDIAWGKLGTPERMARYATWMADAQKVAQTEPYKQRVELFRLSTWDYMKQGADQFQQRTGAPVPSVATPKIADANGDLKAVDWTKAAALPGHFCQRGGSVNSPRDLSGKIACDSKYLYVELTDPCDTKRLVVSPGVYPFDDWELFIAGQREKPYLQLGIGPSGSLSAGINAVSGVKDVSQCGIITASDTTAAGRWVTRVAIPLNALGDAGFHPLGKLYLNVVRVSSPQITGSGLDIDTWVSYTTVHNVDRLGEITPGS